MFSSIFVQQIDHSSWTKAAAVHFLSKRWVVLLHSESMASSSNSHNPLLWDQVSEHRPCAIGRERNGGTLRSSWYQFFILFISSCLSLFASSNHKSLLDAITALAPQWKGGRIDSRAEDERRGGEKRCCKKITVAYAHRKHIDCKIKSPSLMPRFRDPLEVCGPRRYVALWIFKPRCGLPLTLPLTLTYGRRGWRISSFTTALLEQNWKTDSIWRRKCVKTTGEKVFYP